MRHILGRGKAMSAPINNYFDEGMAYFEQRDYAHAVESLTKALRLSLGDIAETHLYRGICYAYLQAYEKAMDDFNRALQNNPYLADAYNERGNLWRLDENYARAIEDYDTAISIEKDHDAAYYNRGICHEKLKQYEEAEEDLSFALKYNSGIAEAYEARGRIRALMKNYEGAINDFERFLRMGGGREFDNQSEIQSFIISLRFYDFLSRFVPRQFMPSQRI
jgi:tetratricopeptide (TPR) repeat protein